MQFIDTHCHLDFPELQLGLRSHISNASDKGIELFIVPGVHLAQIKNLLLFKSKIPQCRIGVGLHPYFLEHHHEGSIERLYELAKSHRKEVIAIGECGIDTHKENIDLQRHLFTEHIKIANTLKLPLIVHHRKSHHLIMQAFKQTIPQHGGVIHAYSGSLQQAHAYVALGFKLGVGGTISYARARKTKAVFAQLPLTDLVLETDAPAMPLSGFQGEANLPERLINVFDHLCLLRDESPEEIAQQIYQSSCALFSI